jgi:hypothetical protein
MGWRARASSDLAWTAGFLEGEGSFTREWRDHGAVVRATQVERWPLDRLVALFGGSIGAYTRTDARHPHGFNLWNLKGTVAVGLMMTLYPMMSPKRRRQITAALTHWRAGQVPNRYRRACPYGHPYIPRGAGRTRGAGRRCQRCNTDAKRRRRRTRRTRLQATGAMSIPPARWRTKWAGKLTPGSGH